ncbi:DNA cytosine methyltransferase [Staphylococcus sp. IVB6214]|uniref:DNA cytosine methyltransferase n=1 Tax=Staphylococcus sp. IVB6214 TaxID=2989766 RepID=UPI0021D26622|nr:DNA cytosine methyltransferase [Staphylococcus sp. IVB6214]UXR83179.1 DNA cytosine methyltransferase [Staphylococcus sp. IVB6214]
MKNLNSIELFAGAGGLALGIEQSGFKHKALIEMDKYASATLRKNFTSDIVWESDITKLDPASLKLEDTIDLISGGSPCQSFSYAGLKRGIEDARGTLFYDYARFVNYFQPKIFVFENVRGIINHDNGATLKTILKVFEEIGYKVTWKLLKAVDYEVAQKRERVFIVGIRQDVYQNLGEYTFPSPKDKRLTLKDALKDVPKSEGAKYPESKRKVLELVPPGGYWRDLPEDIAKEYMGKSYFSGGGKTGMARRMSWEEPSLTLTTSPQQKQTERCHPDETRPFTTREYARIQTFPDDFVFEGSINNVYKQIGNAVPVNLARYVGMSLKEYLCKEAFNDGSGTD